MTDNYLICIDIDGTLTTDSDGHLPAENRKALQDVRKAGHTVMINSGRSFSNMPDELLDTSCFDGWICANGSYIRIRDHVLRNDEFPYPLLHALLDYCITANDRFCLFEGETTLLKVHERSPLYGNVGTQIFHADEIFTRFPDSGVNVMTCEGLLPESFHERFGHALNIIQCTRFADCTLPGNSKAVGMTLAAEYCGIPIERTCAIGDSANDLPMLQQAGISVAMGNAPPEIRSGAQYVTATNLDCGVASVLRREGGLCAVDSGVAGGGGAGAGGRGAA